jgi:hypothetical protein
VANTLNALVVTSGEGAPYPPGEEKVFLTTLPVDDPLAILDQDGLRSLIENTAFRELKQSWERESFPKTTAAAVRAHLLLTLVTFTLVNAFRSKAGQTLSRRGMRRWRTKEESHTVLVFAGSHYAIFERGGLDPAGRHSGDLSENRCRHPPIQVWPATSHLILIVHFSVSGVEHLTTPHLCAIILTQGTIFRIRVHI